MRVQFECSDDDRGTEHWQEPATQRTTMVSCVYCGCELKGLLRISDFGGMACERCWYDRNRFVRKTAFHQVLNNSDDQVVMRQLLVQMVPVQVQERVIREFNRIMEERESVRRSQLGLLPR